MPGELLIQKLVIYPVDVVDIQAVQVAKALGES